MSDPILASGGLVFRPGKRGHQVLVVHRPRYDDWSLPKGKDDPGETPEDAALREVAEETGVVARIVKPLKDVTYVTSQENHKLVRYFAMRAISSIPFVPNEEVDEIRWVSKTEARRLLTYPFDRDLVGGADVTGLAKTGVLFLIRHANAGDRALWNGPDHLRPLSKKGLRQSAALVDVLASHGVDRIVSSPFVRCRQTVEPLAGALGLEVETLDGLAEGSGSHAVPMFEAAAGTNLAVCSHGDVIPACLDLLQRRGMELYTESGFFECKKASTWVVAVDAGSFVEAHYLPPPTLLM